MRKRRRGRSSLDEDRDAAIASTVLNHNGRRNWGKRTSPPAVLPAAWWTLQGRRRPLKTDKKFREIRSIRRLAVRRRLLILVHKRQNPLSGLQGWRATIAEGKHEIWIVHRFPAERRRGHPVVPQEILNLFQKLSSSHHLVAINMIFHTLQYAISYSRLN